MEFKGTKGKWRVGASNRGVVNDDKVILRCAFGENSLGLFKKNEAEANALLTSKAPEMLEMLNELISANPMHDGWHEKILKANKIIQEATEI